MPPVRGVTSTHRGATDRKSSGTHLVDGEHVEVGDVVFLSVLDPGAALLLVDQLADVLVHKLALLGGWREEK